MAYPELTESANAILRERYYRKGESTPEDLFGRVAKHIASAEATDDDKRQYEGEFFDMMRSLRFLPNSPTLVNAGVDGGGCLSACFVVSPEDDMASIMKVASDAAMIEKWGGGVGFGLSKLRPKGDSIKTTHGQACGPVAVMGLYSAIGDTLTQGSFRLGAHMAQLRVSHPDILEFVHCKDGGERLTNFNISVQITDAFMQAVRANADWALVNPRNGETVETVRAQDLWDEICESAWRTGDPGVVFIDKVWNSAPNPQLGLIESSNPCGEENLEDYGNCCLGSINLDRHLTTSPWGGAVFDWNALRKTVRLAVRFLDDVIDVNSFPLPKLREVNLATRRIGLGVMGWADVLTRMGIPYESADARDLAETVGYEIHEVAWAESARLAEARGAFPEWERSRLNDGEKPPVRHSSVTTIAPTGTISRIAGCSSGIEPHYALAWRSKILWKSQEESAMTVVDAPASVRDHYESSMGKEATQRYLEELVDLEPEKGDDGFSTAMSIDTMAHVLMQTAWQNHTTNAVSKTVNLPQHASVASVKRVYEEAYALGCKSVTIYRDGSRKAQVLNAGKEKPVKGPLSAEPPVIMDRPRIVVGQTERIRTGHGSAYITVNENGDGKPFEVFANLGRSGGCHNASLEAIGRLASVAMRSGVPSEEVAASLRGITCCPAWDGGALVKSPADAIAMAIEHAGGEMVEFVLEEKRDEDANEVCPRCDGQITFQEGCVGCLSCGYSKCE